MHMRRAVSVLLFLLTFVVVRGQTIAAPDPQPGTIIGTVEDTTGAIIPGATITLIENAATIQTTSADASASFGLTNVPSAVPLTVMVQAPGFGSWTSPTITLTPGQYLQLTDIQLHVADVQTSVTAIMPEQLALEQVHAEEQQRILGIIPNYFVVYDKNPQPMSTRLKYELAFKAGTDVATIAGSFFLGAINQAGNTPAYGQGWDAYGKRVGASYATGFADVMIGGAILPSLLHQDPRYYYQGTGTNHSRALHAALSPFLCKGDNGKTQFNWSSIGGDLGAGALTEIYYPAANRGPGLVFTSALITTGGRVASAMAQEFLLHRVTKHAKSHN